MYLATQCLLYTHVAHDEHYANDADDVDDAVDANICIEPSQNAEPCVYKYGYIDRNRH